MPDNWFAQIAEKAHLIPQYATLAWFHGAIYAQTAPKVKLPPG
jgi:hypothetical protein